MWRAITNYMKIEPIVQCHGSRWKLEVETPMSFFSMGIKCILDVPMFSLSGLLSWGILFDMLTEMVASIFCKRRRNINSNLLK
jgi:hypothetical protein